MYNRISASISFIILRQIKYRRIFWEGWCLQKLDDFNLNMKTKRVPKIKLFCLLKIPLVTNKLFPAIPAFYAHVGLCQILFTSEFTCDFFQRSFKQSLNSCFVLRIGELFQNYQLPHPVYICIYGILMHFGKNLLRL